jgi:formylglycine-generating enzyme required for sulfatase activity
MVQAIHLSRKRGRAIMRRRSIRAPMMQEEKQFGQGDVVGTGRAGDWRATVGGFIILCCCVVAFAQGEPSNQASASSHAKDTIAPSGMVWIPGAEFTMGTDDVRSFPNERPAHRVQIEGFWIDEHDVTNAEFAKFVEATGYVTTAERKPDWEELKKELPPGTPKPDDKVLVAGSLVFTPTSRPVPLNDL